MTLFLVSERYNRKKDDAAPHEHLEQFNQQAASALTPEGLGLTRPRRVLVSVRSAQHLAMLDKALAEADKATTDIVVLHAKLSPPVDPGTPPLPLDTHERRLLTAVVERAEKAGVEVRPLVLLTNRPLHALLKAAKDLKVQELLLGATRDLHVPDVMLGESNAYSRRRQQQRIADYWCQTCGGHAEPLTVRIVAPDREVRLDLGQVAGTAEAARPSAGPGVG
jgi:hypothetical protein